MLSYPCAVFIISYYTPKAKFFVIRIFFIYLKLFTIITRPDAMLADGYNPTSLIFYRDSEAILE